MLRRLRTFGGRHVVVDESALGPASASWNDFVGTAAADESASGVVGETLYEVAGLDPAAWIILSVDLVAVGSASTVVVYALDRRSHGVGSHADLIELGQETGELPVTAFELQGVDADRVRAAGFERLVVRLVARPFHDQTLTVRARIPLSSLRTTPEHVPG